MHTNTTQYETVNLRTCMYTLSNVLMIDELCDLCDLCELCELCDLCDLGALGTMCEL